MHAAGRAAAAALHSPSCAAAACTAWGLGAGLPGRGCAEVDPGHCRSNVSEPQQAAPHLTPPTHPQQPQQLPTGFSRPLQAGTVAWRACGWETSGA